MKTKDEPQKKKLLWRCLNQSFKE